MIVDAYGDSSNDIKEFPDSSGEASCDLVDHVTRGDSSMFDNSGGGGNARGNSNNFIESTGIGSERDDLGKVGMLGSSAGKQV